MDGKGKKKAELIKELETLKKDRGGGMLENNITKRKQAEKALIESEEKYRTLFENTGTTTMVIEEDKTISMINTQLKKIYGYSKEEIENKMKWTDFILPEDLERMKKYHIARRKSGEKFPTEYEFRMMDKKGNIRNIFMRIGIISNTKKSIASLMDITERKKAEQALQEAHDQLEDKVAQRTEELQNANLKLQGLDQMKSLFITSMSHELMTPLSLIIGFTDIMLQGISGEINPKQRRQLTLVKNNANHLHGLINDAIDVNKIDAGKIEIAIEEFDLSALSREIKDSFILAADKKGLALSFEAPPNLIIESDRTKVQQVLVNLLSNALKFTNRGEIKIKVIQKDTIVEVSVRDTGTGIKEEDMDKLFKSFSQIPNPGRIEEGTGLGLYLSKKNANLLGGDLIAESERGKGSVFTLTLSLKYKEGRV